MNKTKANIISSAIKRFNEDGLVNVRLQHIADEAFISIGNLAYHYKNKTEIVAAIHHQFVEEQKLVMAEMNVVPLFEYIGQFLDTTYHLQERYSFLFTDMLEVFRSYGEVAALHAELIDWQKRQYRLALDFNIGRGAFRSIPELDLGHLTDHLWMSTYMYRSFMLLGEDPLDQEQFNGQVWSLLIPIMTEKGLLEYKQFQQLSIM